MALALDCVCADSGAVTCQITELYWVIEEAASDIGFVALTLKGGPYDVDIPSWIDNQEVDLGDPSPWLAAWDDLYFEFSGNRSVSSDDIETARARFYLKAIFTCADGSPATITSDQEQRATNLEEATDICQPNAPAINAVGSIGPGGVAGFIRHSRPLDPCYGFSVTSGMFSPKPKNTQTVDLFSSPPGSLVLCPSGGSSPYGFGIQSGNLPGGMTLNTTTGELEGSPDGSRPGSKEIVFFVIDGGHEYAEVTCSFLEGCTIVESTANLSY